MTISKTLAISQICKNVKSGFELFSTILNYDNQIKINVVCSLSVPKFKGYVI